jgi:hypothetical protein
MVMPSILPGHRSSSVRKFMAFIEFKKAYGGSKEREVSYRGKDASEDPESMEWRRLDRFLTGV